MPDQKKGNNPHYQITRFFFLVFWILKPLQIFCERQEIALLGHFSNIVVQK